MNYVSKRQPRMKQAEGLEWIEGKRVAALLCAMRTGKTKIIIDNWGAHPEIPDLLVLAPAGAYMPWADAVGLDYPGDDAMIFVWVSKHKKRDAEKLKTFMAYEGRRVLIINIEAISSVAAARDLAKRFLMQERTSMMAVDECFVAGTMVRTPFGDRPIETIREGDVVCSSNGNTVVKTTLKKKSSLLVRVSLSNGKVVIVTPNHPFFTDVGWVCAGNLKGRALYEKESVDRIAGMRGMPEVLHNDSEHKQILRKILLSEMADATAGNSRSGVHERDCGKNKRCFNRKGYGAFSEKGYSFDCGAAAEDGCNAQSHGMETPGAWGEWQGLDEGATGDAGCIRFAVETRGRHRIGREAARLSNMLQGRCGKHRTEAGYRVRRDKSYRNVCEGEGQEERHEAGVVRVESVTFEECGSPVAVFDLELEGTPHFYTEGVLVHNSVTIKNLKSNASKFCVDEIADKATYKRILTGLVSPQSPLDVYQQFRFLSTDIFPESWDDFRKRYCNMRRICQLPVNVIHSKFESVFGLRNKNLAGGRLQWIASMCWPDGLVPSQMVYSMVNTMSRDDKVEAIFRAGRYIPSIQVIEGYKNIAELHERIAPYSFRCRLEDCYDMPASDYSFRDVEMTEEQEKAYQEMLLFATTELANEQHIVASNVITKMLRLHQILCGHSTDEEGNPVEIPENRTASMVQMLEDYDGKAVIWCSYDADVRKVVAALEKTFGNGSVARFWGGNRDTREREEFDFKNRDGCRFMVATPDAGGRGRAWDIANLTIYHSSRNNLDHRAQSEDRVKAVGKMIMNSYVDMRVPGTVEEKFIEALRNKINLADIISGDNYREWLI